MSQKEIGTGSGKYMDFGMKHNLNPVFANKLCDLEQAIFPLWTSSQK